MKNIFSFSFEKGFIVARFGEKVVGRCDARDNPGDPEVWENSEGECFAHIVGSMGAAYTIAQKLADAWTFCNRCR